MAGLFISASGILNAQLRNDITANNIANSQTSGFRASRADSVSVQSGGVRLGGVTHDEAQGPIQFTGRPLDVASNDGFFQVERADGTTAFTRDGHFGLNADGEVVTADGSRLSPPIQAPPNATSVSVTSDGTVFATVPGNDAPQAIGQIEVFQFTNPGGLESVGGNQAIETAASGAPTPVTRSIPVLPGAVQGSNVDFTTEQVNLLLNQRAFEANVNAFRAQSEVLGDLLDLIE